MTIEVKTGYLGGICIYWQRSMKALSEVMEMLYILIWEVVTKGINIVGGNHEATPLRFHHDYVSIKIKGRKKKTQQVEHPIPHEAQRFHFVALTKYSIITKKGPLGYCGSYPHGAISSEV